MTTTENTTSSSLADQISDVIEKDEVSLPPLPEMGQRLLEMLRDPEKVDGKKIAEVVQNDPAITAALLQMANSATFGGLNPVSDISQAIARLGLNRVSSVITTLVMKSNFKSDSSDQKKLLKDLWSHAVATAITARKLASATNGNPEEAYLAGLLHDMGKLLILRAVDHCAASGGSLDLTPIVLNELLDVMHAEVGHKMLAEWQLPEAVCQAALLHHQDAADFEDQLAVRVQAANQITRKLGAHPNPDPDLNLEDLTAIDRLNMSEVELAALMIDVEDEYEKIRQML